MKDRIFLRCRGNFELKKMTPNCNALANSIISYLWVSYFTFVFLDSVKQCYLQTKKHTVTSSERAHSITWYKQKRRRNRWASNQVSRRYTIKQHWHFKTSLNQINVTFQPWLYAYNNMCIIMQMGRDRL